MKTEILKELKEHSPFTIVAVVVSIVLTLVISLFTDFLYTESVFESFHILHVALSALATTIVFYKYDKSIWKTFLIGFVGSIFIGTLSDVVFPYLGAAAFGFAPHLHFPIIEHPLLIIGSAFVGILLGMFVKNTKLPHSFHVFVSVFASLFYLVSFTAVSGWFGWIMSVLIVFVSVLVPCCLSDIIFPLLFVKKRKKVIPVKSKN